MKILLVNPPGSVSFISPPLGLLYIASVLKENGHLPIILDYNLKKLDYNELFSRIKQENIKMLGISIVTPKIHSAIELSQKIKNEFHDEITIVGGGPHVTLMANALLQENSFFDFLVSGEAEYRFSELVNCIENKNEYIHIDGLSYRTDMGVVTNPVKGQIENLNNLPLPSRELIDIHKYSKFMKTMQTPSTTMMTSRGCPYHCIYCSKPVSGSKVRSVSPENVVKEIEFLIKEYGIKEIVFYDDTFTFDKKRTIEICDLIIKRNLKIKWQCETRVNHVDEEVLMKMKNAGCYLIAYGIESGSERVLKILRKGATTNQIRKAVEITRKVGIKVLGYFMMGIPGETEEEIKETIKFSKEIGVDLAQYSISVAYPGTELYKIAAMQNKTSTDWSNSIYALGKKPSVSLSEVPSEVVYKYMKKAYYSFYFRPGFILKRLLSIFTNKDEFQYNLKGLKKLLKT